MIRRTHKIGLDANRPIKVESGPHLGALSDTVRNPEMISETGAAWVRLNFVLGPWAGPYDPYRPQGRTWAETYIGLVDSFKVRGLRVYGLVGHESVKESPEYFRNAPDQMSSSEIAQAQRWVRTYAVNFGEVVKLFRDKISVFESFNEPDDWHGAHQHWIHPSWFAEILQAVYLRVKVELGFHDVKLVSGPLQGLEANGNVSPTNYLRETYRYGKQHFDWGQPDYPFPFDGIGYHLYIKQAFNPNWAVHEQQVRSMYRQYVDGMMNVIQAAEGIGSDTRLYISEIGWTSNGDTNEERAFQAGNLKLALDLINRDPAVELGIWFCTEDFGPGTHFYGLYRMRQISPSGRKPAFEEFNDFCRRFNRGVIAGVLRDQAGEPQSGFRLTLSGPNIEGWVSAITDNAGQYRFEGLPSGSYTLRIVGTGITKTLTSDGDAPITLDLALSSIPAHQGVIGGMLRDQAGTPMGGFTVELSGVGASRSVMSDSNGVYRFDELQAGSYTVSVVGTDLNRQVWSNGQAPVILSLTLPLSAQSVDKGIIQGTLRNQSGLPLGGRRILLTGSGLSRDLSSAADGSYRFDRLPPGTYRVEVPTTGLMKYVWLGASAPVNLDLIVEEN